MALEYLNTATECVSSGKASVLAYLRDDLADAESARTETADLETAADTLRRAIGDCLFSGAYLPQIRGDIFAVIDALDKVPDASEACCDFFIGEKPVIPEELRPAFIDVTTESFGSMIELRVAVKALFKPKGDFKKIREHSRTLSIHESRVDDLEWALTVAIFESEELDLSRKRHLKTALDRVCHISDLAENAADRLELAAMKSVL